MTIFFSTVSDFIFVIWQSISASLSPEQVIRDREIELSIINEIKAGNHHRFEELVEKYQHKIVGMIQRQVKESMIAEDLAQDVFVRAYKGLKNFKGDSAFSTWLTRIAMNVVSSYFASKKFRDKKKSESFDYSKHDKPTASVDAQEEVAEEMREALRAAVAELKPTFREVLTLCAFEGKPYEEAAEILSIPVGTVRSRLNKARNLLREFLGIREALPKGEPSL